MIHETSVNAIDYEKDLNPAQLEAVTTAQGPVLVIAGAGSGKTRTIVYRVAWLVEHGVEPSSVLLLTFTRRAAEEMLQRAARLLDVRVSRVSGGTFHSTGNVILRRYAPLLKYDSSFSIMDQGDAVEAVDHIKKSISPPLQDTKGFPRARTIAEIFSHTSGTESEIHQTVSSRFPHLLSFAPDIERIRVHYNEYKRSNNLMDYDDLLACTIQLLEEHDHVRAEVSRRWSHILVDEYQDTNRLQARLLRLFASEHDNVMVVGDDSQSIYSFRGADFRNIMEFPKLFPGTKLVKLEENYRSTMPILTLTNCIIAGATVGYPKKLFTRKQDGPLPLFTRPASEREQSRFVVQCINELTDACVPLREIAVLFRAGFHSFDLEGELTRCRIPYVKYGGFKFLESLHIKDVLAHLKVIDNYRDRLSWARILRILPGIGVKTALKLANYIGEHGIPLDASDLAPRSKQYWEPVQDLFALIGDLKSRETSIADKADKVNKYYFPFLKEKYDNYPKRMRDLEQLADLAVPYKSLNRFLNDMALDPPDEDTNEFGGGKDALVLSTMHSAKGLEWHTVIVIWAAEGRMPSAIALNSPDELEEERRLMYVAATRAKHNLVITTPRTMIDRQKGSVYVQPSRFVQEIPGEYLRTYM